MWEGKALNIAKILYVSFFVFNFLAVCIITMTPVFKGAGNDFKANGKKLNKKQESHHGLLYYFWKGKWKGTNGESGEY